MAQPETRPQLIMQQVNLFSSLSEMNLLNSDEARLSVSICLMLLYIATTVSVKYRRNNPINRMTMKPYYIIIIYQVLYSVYYFGVCLQEFKNQYRDLRWLLAFCQMQCFFISMILFSQTMQWDLIKSLVCYQSIVSIH